MLDVLMWCCREFLIFAPKIVRPDMLYEVHVTVNRKFYSNIVVTALLSSDGSEYASGRVLFHDVATKVIQLKVDSLSVLCHAVTGRLCRPGADILYGRQRSC